MHRQVVVHSLLNRLHEVYGKMLHLPKQIPTTDGTSLCLMYIDANKGEMGMNWPPRGKDHTYQCDENCVCPHMHHGWLAHWGGGTGLPEMEWWGVLQYLILDVGQLVFPLVLVEGWVIYMDEHCLLDASGNTMWIPAYNGEAVHINSMSCGLAVLVNGVLVLRCSFSLSHKVIPISSYVLLLTVCLGALVSVYYSTFWEMVSVSFGTINRVQVVLLPLKCTYIPRLLHIFKLALSPLV